MKKNLEQASVIKVGDSLYTPLREYHPKKNNGAVIITEVAEIIEDDGRIIIIDTDGDTLRPEWLGVSFFLLAETMDFAFEKNEEKYKKRCVNSHLCKYYSPCSKQR